MPQHASAKKRMVTNERDRKRNRTVKSQVRGAVRTLREAMGGDTAPTLLRQTHAELDKAAKKGVIHRRKVDRLKSRLAKAVRRAAS